MKGKPIFAAPESNLKMYRRLLALLYYKREKYDKFAPWAAEDTGLAVNYLQRLSWDSCPIRCRTWVLKLFVPVIENRIEELQQLKIDLQHQIKRADRIEVMVRRRHKRKMALKSSRKES